MPYDPRMLQMAQMGIGMMGPKQGNPFANQPTPPQRNWWDQPAPAGQLANQPNDTSQSANSPNSPKQPPGLYDMLLNLGKMTRPQYDKAIQGPGAYGIAPKDAAMLGPWGFLGSLGLPGGAGWGGGGGTPG